MVEPGQVLQLLELLVQPAGRDQVLPGKLKHIQAEIKWPPFRRQHFQMHFLNENVWISLKISLKFVPKVLINNILALVQIMAWCRSGDKPLSEPMHIHVYTSLCLHELIGHVTLVQCPRKLWRPCRSEIPLKYSNCRSCKSIACLNSRNQYNSHKLLPVQQDL